jgi:biopolymer transport protein ExbB
MVKVRCGSILGRLRRQHGAARAAAPRPARRRPWPWRPLAVFLLAAVSLLAAEAEAPRQGIVGKTLWETFQRGGWVMYVILAQSVAGLAIAMEVAYRTRRGAILPAASVQRLGGPDREAAVRELAVASQNVCLHRILQAGLTWHKGNPEQIQTAIEERVDVLLWELKRVARPLGIIANTAPLLGLLGTVIGIVEAFDVVARQGALGDPSALADGIAKALLTTVFGLIVAIPTLMAYHYFVGRSEALLRRCEELAKEALVLPPE